MLVLLLSAAPASGIEPDDNIPGVPLPASPLTGALSEDDDVDVYRVDLSAGDTIVFTLSPGATASLDQDYDLSLFGPDASDVQLDYELEASFNGDSHDSITYTAVTAGSHYLAVWYCSGSGNYNLSWQNTPSGPAVYRFLYRRTGTHFYTADLYERDRTIRMLGSLYQYEGVSYRLGAGGTDWLYRFYNVNTEMHFYTADPEERDRLRFGPPTSYKYEGPAYTVSRANDGTMLTVWRFYNRRHRTHFYTADPAERDTVINTLSGTFTYEGVAFYVPQ